MRDSLKLELDALLDNYEIRKKKQQEEYRIQKREEDRFLKRFLLVREQVIKPAMQEIGELLKKRGKNNRIVEEDESVDTKGKLKEARISMFFLMRQQKQGHRLNQYPLVAFIATKSKKRVWVHERTIGPDRGGHSGNAGEYSLEQISMDLVQQKIMKVLRELFEK